MTRADELLLESVYQEMLDIFNPKMSFGYSDFLKTVFDIEFDGAALIRLQVVSNYSMDEAKEVLKEFKETNAMYIMEQI